VSDVDPLAPIENREGLKRAYNEEHRLSVHGDTAYIAGITFTDGPTGHFSLQDAWGNFKIPCRITSKSKISRRRKGLDK
jgi:hypothetical protein